MALLHRSNSRVSTHSWLEISQQSWCAVSKQKTEKQQTHMHAQQGWARISSNGELHPVQQERILPSAGLTLAYGNTHKNTKVDYIFHIYNIPFGKVTLSLQNTGRGGFLSTSGTVQDELDSCKNPDQFLEVQQWEYTSLEDMILPLVLSPFSFTHCVRGLGSGSHTHPLLQKGKLFKCY